MAGILAEITAIDHTAFLTVLMPFIGPWLICF
jgi:hypothetical protein